MTTAREDRVTHKRAVVFVLQCILVLALAWALYDRRHTLAAAADVSGADLLGLFLLSWLAAPLRAIELSSLTRVLGSSVSFTESLALSQASTLLNYLPIPAGTMVRARVLKRHRDLSYTRYIGLMTTLVALAATSSAVVGLVMLGLGNRLPQHVSRVALIVFSTVTGLFIGVIALPLRSPAGHGRLATRLRELIAAWSEIVVRRRIVLTLFITSAGTPLLLGLRYLVAFHALSQPVEYTETALLAAGILVSMPTPITPGSIGVREFLGGAIGTAAGLEFGQVLAALALDRAMNMAHVVSGGFLSMWWLRKKRLL